MVCYKSKKEIAFIYILLEIPKDYLLLQFKLVDITMDKIVRAFRVVS